MAEMSNYLEDALINATLRATTFTSPATVYVSLHTADPTDDGSGTEVSGGSYARQSASFGAPSNGASSTDSDITFPQATGSWGTITHIGIWDAVSSGNMYYHTQLDASKTIDTADIFKIASGSLTVTLA
jgi:hypothetical protein